VIKKFFFQYFGLIALVFVLLSALAGAISYRSLLSGLLAGLAAVGVIIVYFILLGLVGAAMERLDELRAETAQRGTSLPVELARAWAWGLVLWIPANPLLTQFLLVWAAIGIAAVFLVPRLLVWSRPGQVGAAVAFLVAAGFINAAFHRGPP
jgi:hypothetical protein